MKTRSFVRFEESGEEFISNLKGFLEAVHDSHEKLRLGTFGAIFEAQAFKHKMEEYYKALMLVKSK